MFAFDTPPKVAAVGNSTGEHTTTMHQLSKAP